MKLQPQMKSNLCIVPLTIDARVWLCMNQTPMLCLLRCLNLNRYHVCVCVCVLCSKGAVCKGAVCKGVALWFCVLAAMTA